MEKTFKTSENTATLLQGVIELDSWENRIQDCLTKIYGDESKIKDEFSDSVETLRREVYKLVTYSIENNLMFVDNLEKKEITV